MGILKAYRLAGELVNRDRWHEFRVKIAVLRGFFWRGIGQERLISSPSGHSLDTCRAAALACFATGWVTYQAAWMIENEAHPRLDDNEYERIH
jgi:hypothetical protein